MLDKLVWHEAALRANLPQGHRRRFPHTCGAGEPVLVTNHPDGLHAWCFRCGEGIVIKHTLSLAERIELAKQRKVGHESFREYKLPHDFTTDLPSAARLWFGKGGIRLGEIRSYGFGYSPSMQRIILPVYGPDGALAFSQARAIQTHQTPKYINSGGSAASRALFRTTGADSFDTVVVTEDILSAIRCGRYMAGSALCGVSLSDAKLLKLLHYKTVLCFLDPDPAGQQGMRKFLRRMQVMHPDVRKITARADPKNLTNKELYETIRGGLT